MNSIELISVIMSTYNETEEELSNAINSILNQTYKRIEFIIILDNPDNVSHVKLINKIAQKDSRVRFYINEQNIGLANSLNRGIEYAKSNIIARMDADDISFDTRLEEEYNIITTKEVDIVSSNIVYIDEDGKSIDKDYYFPKESDKINKILEYSSIIVHPSVMFKKDRINQIGNYRNFACSQDYDLWLRAVDNDFIFYIIDKPLLKYRIRKNGITGKNPLKQFIITDYIKLMHKQRIKKGFDSFSYNNVINYLIKNKYDDDVKIEKFKKSMNDIDKIKKLMKIKKYLSSIVIFIKLYFSGKWSRKLIINYTKSFLTKRGLLL